ncbi:MAG: 6-phosphogluconolactonase [Asticcacaulis sp.]
MTEVVTAHPVRAFATAGEAEAEVVRLIGEALSAAIAERGHALWIGAGGGTPKPVYQQLDTLDLAWDKITLSQVDERFVPVDDAASNTKMMGEACASVIARGMVFETLIRDIGDAGVCAQKAETLLRDLRNGDAPVFDLTLLGMGPDRHYASIFPGHAINATVYDTDALVLPVEPATGGVEPKLPRITLSVKALNASRRIVLYITGQEKREALSAALADPDPWTSPIGAFLKQCPAPVDIIWCP